MHNQASGSARDPDVPRDMQVYRMTIAMSKFQYSSMWCDSTAVVPAAHRGYQQQENVRN